jgi:hypothetical protein
MITIEIQDRNVTANKKLIKKIFKQLPRNAYFHFLFEPELIIRVKNKERKCIIDYLKRKNIQYRVYSYPFPKKGFGESKKSVIYKYQDEFKELFHYGSLLTIKQKNKDKFFIIERHSHTFLNMMGFSWLGEVAIYNWLLEGRIKAIKKYDCHSLIDSVICQLIILLTKWNKFLMKRLNYE